MVIFAICIQIPELYWTSRNFHKFEEMPKSGKGEFRFNLFVWIVAVIYSLYNVIIFTNKVDKYFSDYGDDMEAGWPILGRLKDVSDYEWNIWKRLLLFLFPWLYFNSMVAKLVETFQICSVNKVYTLISLALIFYKFGFTGLLIFLCQPLIYYAVICFGSGTKVIWITSVCLMLCVNAVKRIYENTENNFTEAENDNLYLTIITISWINLRCISYSLEVVRNGYGKKKYNSKVTIDLWDMFGYIFYAPVLFLGPVILYNDFDTSFKVSHQTGHISKLVSFIFNFSRYLFWLFVIEFCLHFIYIEAFIYHTEVVKLMPNWCLYGSGLWMGLYFYLKYLVVYGMAGSWVALDDIEPQTPPRCVLRVHRYSQMWKYFDVGLHKFLLRYIYKPVVDGVNKDKFVHLSCMRALGSLLCFLFIYCWHGAHDFILIWTVLNYLGIVIESISKTLAQTEHYKEIKKSILKTPQMVERFEALLATPLLIMSALSNFYFFAGSEVGNVFLNRLANQSCLSSVILFFCLYCSCRAAQNLDKVQASKIRMCVSSN